ncbi:MAG: MbnH family di-heme enzyme, partial [Myxococcota bacterium]
DWSALLPTADFPPPRVPDDNPMSLQKVELGRRLFYDRRLSGNETQSCGSCHELARGFSDGLAVSEGSTGELTPRNSMALGNVAYATTLTWGNPLLRTLEAQVLIPMFGEDPVELGLSGRDGEMLERLRRDSLYPSQFRRAFDGDPDPINIANIAKAIAAFQRTLITFNSPYDRATYKGEPEAMSDAARRGELLFFSEKFECFHCHGGANFSAATVTARSQFLELAFFNNGLYNVDGEGGYPVGNTGVHEITNDPRDMGRMRPPSLRNIAVTAPYMHDGSLATLDDVLDHYARAGTLTPDGPNAGDGALSPLKNDFIVGFTFEGTEREDLKAFLNSLTDPDFLSNPDLGPVE